MRNIPRVVRVGVSTNFNCTPAEWEQLDALRQKHSNSQFFVNCNINTPLLHTVNDHDYKVVITYNPNIRHWRSSFPKLERVDKEKVAFLRIKYVPGLKNIFSVISTLTDLGYPVVITLQRWNSKASLREHCDLADYKWSHNRFRLHGEALDLIQSVVKHSTKKIFICDNVNAGCQSCMLCSFLPTDSNLPIYSLDLSSSGICPYNCPDCYAKTMQQMAKGFGYRPIIFDMIRRNTKQAGRTGHIRDTLKEIA